MKTIGKLKNATSRYDHFCLLQVSSLCIYTTQHDPHISYPRIYNDFFSTAPSPIMSLDFSTN